jgi:cytidylate kinase
MANAEYEFFKQTITTIDGGAATGKSTLARDLAQVLEIPHLDTGGLYRAVTWMALNELADDILPTQLDPFKIGQVAQFVMNKIQLVSALDKTSSIYFAEVDITSAIRTPRVSEMVAHVSKFTQVRHHILMFQQKFAATHGCVAEGRDLGNIVFPEADFKFFLTASDQVRAQRRLAEYGRNGNSSITFDEVLANIIERDRLDRQRKNSPMIPANDAWIIDTSELTSEQLLLQVRAAIGTMRAERRRNQNVLVHV